MDTETVTRWMRDCAAAIAEQRDYLTQLDAAIGDADHGANMTRGFAAVQAKLDDLDGGTPPGKLLVAAGSTLVSTVGGASGPLWGSGLRRAGRALGDAEPSSRPTLVDGARRRRRGDRRARRGRARRQDDGRRARARRRLAARGRRRRRAARRRRLAAARRRPRRACARPCRCSRARDGRRTSASARSATRIPGATSAALDRRRARARGQRRRHERSSSSAATRRRRVPRSAPPGPAPQREPATAGTAAEESARVERGLALAAAELAGAGRRRCAAEGTAPTPRSSRRTG